MSPPSHHQDSTAKQIQAHGRENCSPASFPHPDNKLCPRSDPRLQIVQTMGTSLKPLHSSAKTPKYHL